MNKINKFREAYDKLATDYDNAAEISNEEICLENSQISECLKNQVSLQIRWEHMVARTSSLYDDLETEVEAAYAAAYRNVMENEDRKWSTNEAKVLASQDDNYLEYKRLFNKTKKLKREAEGVLKTIESRKFILNNFSNLIVHGCERTIL